MGNQNAPSSTANFFLSDDDKYDEQDILLKGVSIGSIKAGGNKAKKLSYSLAVGESASGKYMIAVIDKGDVVTGFNEDNNQVIHGPLP